MQSSRVKESRTSSLCPQPPGRSWGGPGISGGGICSWRGLRALLASALAAKSCIITIFIFYSRGGLCIPRIAACLHGPQNLHTFC